jgi:hypothetical protein
MYVVRTSAIWREYHDELLGYGVHDYPYERLWHDYTWYSYAGWCDGDRRVDARRTNAARRRCS